MGEVATRAGESSSKLLLGWSISDAGKTQVAWANWRHWQAVLPWSSRCFNASAHVCHLMLTYFQFNYPPAARWSSIRPSWVRLACRWLAIDLHRSLVLPSPHPSRLYLLPLLINSMAGRPDWSIHRWMDESHVACCSCCCWRRWIERETFKG